MLMDRVVTTVVRVIAVLALIAIGSRRREELH
jgi:hypothetical protein